MAQPAKLWNSSFDAGHYGTLGCLVRWMDRPGILSASHVLAPIRQGLSVGANQRVSILGGNAIEDAVILSNWDVPIATDGTPLASRDAAWATVSDSCFKRLTATVALPRGVRRATQLQQRAHFWGVTSGRVKTTQVHDIAGSVTMRYKVYDGNGEHPSYRRVGVPLSGLIQCDAEEPVMGGDSGCLLFDDEGFAIGLLLGTDPEDIYPYFAHLQPVLDTFGVSIVSAAEFPNAARLADMV